MPIDKQEFENGKLHSGLEDEIVSFLKTRNERAFTTQEIMGGLDYRTEFSTPEITKMSTFAIADFTSLLHDLVKRGMIAMRVVRGQMYFISRPEKTGNCPKCGLTVDARKTWKMAGRPDKTGKSLQLHIGLFNCPDHGFFRMVLDKQKITARQKPRGKKGSRRKTRSKATKKRAKKPKISKRRKTQARKKRKKRESFPLF